MRVLRITADFELYDDNEYEELMQGLFELGMSSLINEEDIDPDLDKEKWQKKAKKKTVD